MAAKSPSDAIQDVKKKIINNLDSYIKSRQFEIVAEQALVDFIKRVKRGLMPDLSKIPELSEDYQDVRQRYKKGLGKLAKASKSNATATGQMLDAMVYKITQDGFALYVKDSTRSKELNGQPSKLTNAEVAGYYALERYIFDFSEPERKRIIRTIKKDLIDLIKKV